MHKLGQISPADAEIVANNALIDRTARGLGNATLGMVGGGAAVRGLLGLKNLLLARRPTPPSNVLTLDLPIPEDELEDKKAALNAEGISSNPLIALLQRHKTNGQWNAPNYWLGQGHPGQPARSPWDMPLAPAATMAVPLAAGYGSYKLVDWLLDKNRKVDADSDLDDAKADYQQALASQYKTAAAGSLAADLDELYTLTKDAGLRHPDHTKTLWAAQNLNRAEALAKQDLSRYRSNKIDPTTRQYMSETYALDPTVFDSAPLADLEQLVRAKALDVVDRRYPYSGYQAALLPKQASIFDKLVSGYGAYAVPTAAIAGLATYQATKRQQKEKILEQAYALKRRRDWARRPPTLEAELMPLTNEDMTASPSDPL